MNGTPPAAARRWVRLPRWPGLHWASIRGRAWADAGALLLAVLVIALATLLASVVPQEIRSTGDAAVQDAVTRAGRNAAVVVNAPFERDDNPFGFRIRPSHSVEIVDDSADRARELLPPDLAAALNPPVASVTSTPLLVSGHGPGRTFQLAYIAGDNARVVWTDGVPPPAGVPAEQADTASRPDGEGWPVQVGLSQATATELGVVPGDRIEAQDRQKKTVEIRVSGIFRPVDTGDPGWPDAPELLQPLIGADGTGTRIELAGLMSADSLPDGRLALEEDDVTRTITFAPKPDRLRWDTVPALVAAVLALKGSSGGYGPDELFQWETRLDSVLQDVRASVAAASAQATVLLVGLIATATLVLLLAADLLVRRRATALAGARMRGASLPGIGAELLIEASLMTLAGSVLGLVLGRMLAGGYSWPGLLPVVLVATVAGPVLGTLAASRATRGRQAPANRSARRSAGRTGQLRRVALETAVVLAAAGAFTALHQRGVLPAGPDDDGGNLLPAVAPTLGAATGALLLLRLLPLGVRLALSRATRSRRSLPLFAAARAAATAARPLPFIAVIMSSALLTFALALSATESNGQAQGAWQSIGADARLEVSPAASVPALAQRVAAADGVRQAVAARVADNVMVLSEATVAYVRLVVVDSAAFSRLLAGTPLPDAPQLGRLTPKPAAGAHPPALLRSADGALARPTNLTVRWNDTRIELTPVGTAPAVGDGEGNVLVVDAATFAAAGADAPANTVWAIGPGAPAAATAVAGSGDVVTLRADALAARRSAPLAAGLLLLANTSVGVLLLWGLLGVLLGAAAGGPARGETLARLRTLGLRPEESRRVAAGELLPPVLVGGLGGLALGVLLAHASLGLLALRLLTGQATDPALVLPWVSVLPVLLLAVAVLVVVRVESSLRRRERLGQVLRAGNP